LVVQSHTNRIDRCDGIPSKPKVEKPDDFGINGRDEERAAFSCTGELTTGEEPKVPSILVSNQLDLRHLSYVGEPNVNLIADLGIALRDGPHKADYGMRHLIECPGWLI